MVKTTPTPLSEYLELSNKVKDLFDQIDLQAEENKKEFSLSCPAGCGQCCLSQQVEVTILDFLPLIIELHANQEIGYWQNRLIKQSKNNNTCIFCQQDNPCHDQGKCLIYKFRPCFCRYYGSAFIKNKYGHPVPAVCKVQKKFDGMRKLTDNLAPVVRDRLLFFSALPQSLSSVSPILGSRWLLINQAFSGMCEKFEQISRYDSMDNC